MTTATMNRPTAAKADSRMAKACELLQHAHQWHHGTVKTTGERIHLVPGSTAGRAYWTTPTACTCPDYQSRGLVCKHAIAVALHLAQEASEAACEAAQQLDGDAAHFTAWVEKLDRAEQLQRDMSDLYGAVELGVAA